MLSEQVLASPPAPESGDPRLGEASLDLEPHLKRLEGRLIRQALARVGGNRTQAAKLLGISRNGLAIKMERLGLSTESG